MIITFEEGRDVSTEEFNALQKELKTRGTTISSAIGQLHISGTVDDIVEALDAFEEVTH